MIGNTPYAKRKYREVKGSRMAYVDEGEGHAIVFQHGQPTSSYVWRNVLPHVERLGRLVACDLIGMGASDKLTNTGPASYSLAEHAKYLFALWDALHLGDRIVLVLDDWGAALGFWWARLNPERVRAIVHMEAVAVADELLRPSRGGACCLQGAPLAGRRGDGAQGEHLHRAGAEARDDPPPQPRRD